ncbi:MAG: outer membrane beta-barrel protein [Paludibacteraceae bacterium]
MKKNIGLLIFSGFVLAANAQNDSKLLIGIDVCGGGAYGTMNDNWEVRQSIHSNYSSDYEYENNSSQGSVSTSSSVFYLTVKPEYRFSDKFSVASGLRFTKFGSNFNGNGASGKYFFLRMKNTDDTRTDYYRIKSINEQNSYLGIPLEAKYMLFSWGDFRFYGKVGYEFGYLLHKKLNITFQQQEMQQYEQDIFNNIGLKPNNFYSSIGGAFGVNYQTKNNWHLNVDLFMGSGLLTHNNTTLINLKSMSGVQFSVMMPIKIAKK